MKGFSSIFICLTLGAAFATSTMVAQVPKSKPDPDSSKTDKENVKAEHATIGVETTKLTVTA